MKIPAISSPFLKIVTSQPDNKEAKMLEILKHSAKKMTKNIIISYDSAGNMRLESISEIMLQSAILGKEEFLHLAETNREGFLFITGNLILFS